MDRFVVEKKNQPPLILLPMASNERGWRDTEIERKREKEGGAAGRREGGMEAPSIIHITVRARSSTTRRSMWTL